MNESRSIQGFHQISCYFQFHLNTEAQPASETRLALKKNHEAAKEPKKKSLSLRDELCKIGLGYVELATGGTDLKYTCQIIKTGCGIPQKNERKNICGLRLQYGTRLERNNCIYVGVT